MNWNKDFTYEEVEELVKSDLNLEGWKGVTCAGCKPKQEAPFPATVNLPSYIQVWQCPRCNFINLLTWRKELPLHLYPDYGALGSVITKVYKNLELIEKEILNEENS